MEYSTLLIVEQSLWVVAFLNGMSIMVGDAAVQMDFVEEVQSMKSIVENNAHNGGVLGIAGPVNFQRQETIKSAKSKPAEP